ncbi:VWA domain-containing protein [Haloquadratum walsbyi]|uniref:VWA domain-containing protein n=1 Tax=Haloquadratum walsbyi TaxID=293091 RepID=UPI0015F4F749|nr:vWA domain-containing protein [Haloquadratum walsbyi]
MKSQTHVTFVLDSSGSMSKIADDTRGGFNTFLMEQREEEGEAAVTLYDFDSTVELVYRGSEIADAETLDTDNYRPGGKTALHDAIARAIDETDDYIAAADVENVIIVVLTDGKENASETPQNVVRERVEEYREEHGWEFLFIGANQDAALTAEQMGMDRDRSLDMAHDGDGAEAAHRSVSESISQARNQGTTGGFDRKDRQRQERTED